MMKDWKVAEGIAGSEYCVRFLLHSVQIGAFREISRLGHLFVR